MMEHDIDGLMRRVLNLKMMYPTEGARSIDYNRFVSEQENLILELQRKLSALSERNTPY
jgi:hypothetical protein